MKQRIAKYAFGLAALFLTLAGISQIGYAASPEASGAAASDKADAVKGKAIYVKSCANCHGATGTEGAIGPSLKGEKSKKTTEQLVTFMKTNGGPMPRLFPKPLSEQDTNDVIAYMNTL